LKTRDLKWGFAYKDVGNWRELGAEASAPQNIVTSPAQTAKLTWVVIEGYGIYLHKIDYNISSNSPKLWKPAIDCTMTKERID